MASREHSRWELARKLRSRGWDEGELETLIAALDAQGLVSDARMAETFVAERLRKGFGPLRVRQELRRRGVADDLIEPQLDLTDREWLLRMMAVHDKKYGTERAGDLRERGRRARFLEYRGFPSELIGRFLQGNDEL